MLYTDKEILYQLQLYPDVHPPATINEWTAIDEMLRREHAIRLPELAVLHEGESLERLNLRTNYAKIVVLSTVTMVLSGGLTIKDHEGKAMEGTLPFPMSRIRRLIRYVSQYGAAWKLTRPNDRRRPIRVYKPHVAREIYLEDDPDVVKAVLAIETIHRRSTTEMDLPPDRRARWYEWDDSTEPNPAKWNRVIRRTYLDEGSTGSWRRLPDEAVFNYMPMELIRNRDTDDDRLFEASDVYDALPVFRSLDDLSTKFMKAMEDEAFRITFLANVTAEQFVGMLNASAMNMMFADNGAEGKEPRPYWANPADHRQYLDAFRHLMNRISTLTRTSPLELDERPVQDIPAQTLEVLYGPQLSRCQETAESLQESLTEDLRLMGVDGNTVSFAPRIPLNKEKQRQSAKGMLDSKAYSRVQLLIDTGMTRAEAERILDEVIDEERRLQALEVEGEVEVIEAEAEAAAANPPPLPPQKISAR